MKSFPILLFALFFSGCSLFSPDLYETKDLTFHSNNLKFTGTLYTPKDSTSLKSFAHPEQASPEMTSASKDEGIRNTTIRSQFPLIVIAHGAGDAKRSFSVYTEYAEYFSTKGFAVFVFDKRGVGDSEGTYIQGEIHLDSLADDLAAAFRFASRLPEVLPGRSGILGISQAGWVIPLAMQKIDTIAFVVNISGPSVPPYFSNAFYRENELRDDGFTDAEILEITEYNRAISRYVGTFDDRQAALSSKAKFKDRGWFKKLGYNPILSPEDTLRLPRYDHYRRDAFDPAPYWNRPNVPVLCLFGDKDSHIPVDTIARRFEDIFTISQFSNFTIKRFPNSGHILQHVDGPREVIAHDPISMILKGFPKATEESMRFVEVWVKKSLYPE